MPASLDELLKSLGDFESLATQKIAELKSSARGSEKTLADAEALRIEWIGKKGFLTSIMKELGGLSGEDRPKVGARANEIRGLITSALDGLSEELKNAVLVESLKKERVDVTLPGRGLRPSYEHPVQMVQDELVNIFESCGFVAEIGPEVEHEFYNFDALNFPKNHPARAMQDTFFVNTEQPVVLRTHTSPVQVRTMLRMKAPIRMLCPGRVYRADYDATHSPMFHQIEGLLIDRNVHMGDLKGILAQMLKEFFGASLNVRLRPSFFPFTEPSAEVDMECVFCKAQGCKTCKQTGWIEIGGCGMVDPEVLKAVSYDLESYRGFAFGMGLERMAMLKYGIDDLRSFFESDHRFISQFARWRV